MSNTWTAFTVRIPSESIGDAPRRLRTLAMNVGGPGTSTAGAEAYVFQVLAHINVPGTFTFDWRLITTTTGDADSNSTSVDNVVDVRLVAFAVTPASD